MGCCPPPKPIGHERIDINTALNAVINAIETDKDHVVALTQDLVRIPSVNPKFKAEQGLNREADVQNRIEEELCSLDFGIERFETDYAT